MLRILYSQKIWELIQNIPGGYVFKNYNNEIKWENIIISNLNIKNFIKIMIRIIFPTGYLNKSTNNTI